MGTIQYPQSPDFKVCEGPIYQAMPKLIEAGYVPASAAQIMRHLLGVKLDRDHLAPFGQPYDSGDAIVYPPDGKVDDRKVKLVWDSQHLREFTSESELCSIVDGALPLPENAWHMIDGEVLSNRYLHEYCAGKWVSKREALNNRVWQWLARDDKYLLKEYADRVFSIAKSRYRIDEAMALYVQGCSSGFAPALYIWSLGGDGSAVASGLDHEVGRLVGVPKSQAHPEKLKVSRERTTRTRVVQKNEVLCKSACPQQSSLDMMLAFAKDYVPDKIWNDFEARLRAYWKKQS